MNRGKKMAVEEQQIVRLKDEFYRDGFFKVVFSLVAIIIGILLLIALSIYLYLAKPSPVNFKVDEELRVLPPVPLNIPYISTADLIQWVSESLPKSFTFDFVNYQNRLKDAATFYTTNGWNKFLEQVNVYANYNTVQDSKLFINSYAAGAPFILNQGLLEGRYAWWIQMPINLNYFTVDRSYSSAIVLQVLVVRVPTLNNLSGVGIENMIVNKGAGDQLQITNG